MTLEGIAPRDRILYDVVAATKALSDLSAHLGLF